MGKAITLKDSQGNVEYPVTKAKITYLSDNTTDVETALGRKANTEDLADVAFSGSYNDLSDTPTNVSEFTNDAGYQTAAQVNTAITTITDPINNAIDKSLMSNLAVKDGVSTTAVELTKSFQNIKTGAATSTDFALPVASSTQAGVMNSQTFSTVQDNADKIEAILGGSVAIEGLPESPSQAELTAAWKEETGRDELFNQAGIFDADNDKIWTYYTNDETWHYVNAGGAVVTRWATGVAGTVVGSADAEGNEGKLFAETDGTGSVIGWDALNTQVTNNTTNIENLQEGKEDAIEAGEVTDYFRGDKTWQTLDKEAVGLGNVDNTSDETKKANFTAESIAEGETGFTTGGQVAAALADKEGAIEAGTTSQYFRGDKTWQTLNKAAVGLDQVDNTSDATKKTNFTGAIAEGNTGFATGGDVYDALEDKADISDIPALYSTKGQNTDGAMTQKAVSDELDKCVYFADEVIIEDIED